MNDNSFAALLPPGVLADCPFVETAAPTAATAGRSSVPDARQRWYVINLSITVRPLHQSVGGVSPLSVSLSPVFPGCQTLRPFQNLTSLGERCVLKKPARISVRYSE